MAAGTDLTALGVAVVVLLVACGGDDGAPSEATTCDSLYGRPTADVVAFLDGSPCTDDDGPHYFAMATYECDGRTLYVAGGGDAWGYDDDVWQAGTPPEC